MMFTPGDKVVCINDDFPSGSQSGLLAWFDFRLAGAAVLLFLVRSCNKVLRQWIAEAKEEE